MVTVPVVKNPFIKVNVFPLAKAPVAPVNTKAVVEADDRTFHE